MKQYIIDDYIHDEVYKKIRLIELFAGYGSTRLALENIGADYEVHKVVEFDKYAIKTYNSLNRANISVTDIRDVKDLNITQTDKYNYILTYSFPCTDLSNIGEKGGMGKGSNTRSSLLWEVERLLNCNNLPQVLLMENVPSVHWKNNIKDFKKWCEYLESKGYHNKWKDLNAKDYGVAQNRKRTFMISILNNNSFTFPKELPLNKTLHNYLEYKVSDSYCLTDKMLNFFRGNSEKQKKQGNGFRFNVLKPSDIAKTITTRNGSRMDDNFIQETTSSCIRKLTPRECFRLMGLSDTQIDRVFESGNSNTQLYKQAGNSIVVNILEEIFKSIIRVL